MGTRRDAAARISVKGRAVPARSEKTMLTARPAPVGKNEFRAMEIGHRGDQAQAKSTFLCRPAPFEAIEPSDDAIALFAGNPRPVVRNGQHRRAASGRELDQNPGGVLRVTKGVLDEIDKQLASSSRSPSTVTPGAIARLNCLPASSAAGT